MLIRMLIPIGAMQDHSPAGIGDVIDVPEETALDYARRNMAVPVEAEVRSEVVEPPRNAAARIGKVVPRKGT